MSRQYGERQGAVQDSGDRVLSHDEHKMAERGPRIDHVDHTMTTTGSRQAGCSLLSSSCLCVESYRPVAAGGGWTPHIQPPTHTHTHSHFPPAPHTHPYTRFQRVLKDRLSARLPPWLLEWNAIWRLKITVIIQVRWVALTLSLPRRGLLGSSSYTRVLDKDGCLLYTAHSVEVTNEQTRKNDKYFRCRCS